MTQITLNPSADTTILNSNGGGNYGTQGYLAAGEVNNGNDLWRSLMKFDLSSIPASATITNATLSFYVYDNVSNGNGRAKLYLATGSWTETGATWNNSNSLYNSGAVITYVDIIDNTVGTNTWTGLAQTIQNWVNGTTNNGFFIRITSTSDDSENDRAFFFFSREDGIPSRRPLLTVDYTLPSGGFPIFFGNTAIA